MRTDKNLVRSSFRFSGQWKRDPLSRTDDPAIDQRLGGGEVVNGKFIAHSLSGHERNCFFFNDRGRRFLDMSAVSGMDTQADSRGFVLLDYDRDGWQDVALVNANAPLLNLYHNQIGPARSLPDPMPSPIIALRFVGGNHSNTPSKSLACRDGYGAMVTVSLDQLTIKREHRCGEGFATQNSDTLIVGIGKHSAASSVRVRWPSGQTQQVTQVPAGTLLTVYEMPSQSPTGAAFVSEPYRVDSSRPQLIATDNPPHDSAYVFAVGDESPDPPATSSTPQLRLYTTMATWCPSCKKHLPQLRLLKTAFENASVQLIGLPVDPADTEQMLEQYADTFQPAYRLLPVLSPQQRSQLDNILRDLVPAEALPSTIVTDDRGRVLLAMAGVPSVSQLRKLLAARALPAQ